GAGRDREQPVQGDQHPARAGPGRPLRGLGRSTGLAHRTGFVHRAGLARASLARASLVRASLVRARLVHREPHRSSSRSVIATTANAATASTPPANRLRSLSAHTPATGSTITTTIR